MPGILLGALAIAAAYGAALLPPPLAGAAPWLMAAGTSLLLLSLVWLGTHRAGRRRPTGLIVGLVVLGLILSGGFAAALLLPKEAAGSPLWLGLPRRAALLLYGVGILPAVFLPALYGLGFSRGVLDQTDLAEFRARLRAE